jgi:hypothetical protein
MTDKSLHDEVTELTAAVRELRDRELAETVRELRTEVEKLRAERAERAGHCGCTHTHIHTNPGWWQTYPIQPYVVTCDSGASYVTNQPVSTGTLAASGTPVWGESVYAGPAGATVMGSGYTVSATN